MNFPNATQTIRTDAESQVTRLALLGRDTNVFGYELRSARRTPLHGDSTETISAFAGYLARLSEREGLSSYVGTRPAFITVDESFLRSEEYRLFPAGQTYLLLHSDYASEADEDAGDLNSLFHSARRAGYRIGLAGVTSDTFGVGKIPKVDIVTIDNAAQGTQASGHLAGIARQAGVLACACSVQNPGQFAQLQGQFDLFQGFFYQRKKESGEKAINTGRLATLQLLTECSNPDATLEMFESIIGRDPTLTLRVMQLANSGFASLSRRLNSLREALITVGVRNVRNLAMIASLNRLEDSQRELLVNCLVRAKMCEGLARNAGVVPSTAFTAGLLSMLDAFVGLSLAEAADLASLSDELKAAIVNHEGVLGKLVASSIAYERAAFVGPPTETMTNADVAEAYLSAVMWAQDQAITPSA